MNGRAEPPNARQQPERLHDNAACAADAAKQKRIDGTSACFGVLENQELMWFFVGKDPGKDSLLQVGRGDIRKTQPICQIGMDGRFAKGEPTELVNAPTELQIGA